MEPATTRIGREYRKVGGIVLTVSLAVLIGGLATLPARADDDNRGRDQHERSYQPQPSYRSEGPRRDYRYEERRYVYAPPPVYYAPPPRRPVIDLVFPFEFR